MRLWDAESGKPLGEPLKGHKGPVTSVAFSPDGYAWWGSWLIVLSPEKPQTPQTAT